MYVCVCDILIYETSRVALFLRFFFLFFIFFFFYQRGEVLGIDS